MNDAANYFLQRLRSETAASHKSLEQLPVSAMLMSSDVNVQHYINYLEKMYGFLVNFEKLVYPKCASIVADIKERNKTEKLRQDLVILQVSPNSIKKLSEELFTQKYQTLFQALGGVYVMEGSTLGGQFISRHLIKVLGEQAAGKMNYFLAYGAETGSRWKSFLAAFSDAAVKNYEEDQIILSAKYTFQLLEEWLSGKKRILSPVGNTL